MMTSILNQRQLEAAAPAIFTEEAAPHTSNRYGFISTASVLGAFEDQGYFPVQAKQDQARLRDPRYVTHSTVLRHINDIEKGAMLGAEVPQILLLNSHNGRTMLRMRAGLYRFVCANGLVVGEDKFKAEFRHQQSADSIARSFAETMAEGMSDLQRAIDAWKHIELSKQRAFDFAKAAAELRFGASAGAYNLESILEAHRTEDDGRTLWQVYNVAQENMTKGGLVGENANGRRVTSRALTAVEGDIDFNDRLWALAGEFAEAA